MYSVNVVAILCITCDKISLFFIVLLHFCIITQLCQRKPSTYYIFREHMNNPLMNFLIRYNFLCFVSSYCNYPHYSHVMTVTAYKSTHKILCMIVYDTTNVKFLLFCYVTGNTVVLFQIIIALAFLLLLFFILINWCQLEQVFLLPYGVARYMYAGFYCFLVIFPYNTSQLPTLFSTQM